MKKISFFTILLTIAFFSCKNATIVAEDINQQRAIATFDSIYKHYSAPNSNLLRETFPFDDTYTATYLANQEQANIPNQYSYLWPYSGMFTAANILFEDTNDKKYKDLLDNKILVGLEEYFDTKREPAGYASYINSAPQSDRFYDDNVWLGIDFTDIYSITLDNKYLEKAKLIWRFIESGTDEKLGGGIYWCEQKKGSKNTCSNAPGAVFALKLFQATKDSTYYQQGKSLYEWTYSNLRDSTDNLYFDNIHLDGKVEKNKYAYNSGQMLQAAAMLYTLTNDKLYLDQAKAIAESAYNHFFASFEPKEGEPFRLIRGGDVWFTAVMMRGFIELYNIDKNAVYIDAFRKSLDYAWLNSREETGLFNKDWKGEKPDKSKWLLTQAAMVEMYGRLAKINK